MKISFLVTYYNQEEYVEQSLNSILAVEKTFDWEILVGDDGSTDGTIDIVKKYVEKYPDHIFCHIMDREPNRKYETVRRSSANRLNLIKHMTGDYFCVLDGDDYYCDKNFVKEAINIFEEKKELSIVAFGYQKFTDEKGIISKHVLPKGNIAKSEYLKKMYTPGGACVLKSFNKTERLDLLNKVGYYDDNDIIVNSLSFGEIYAVDKIIYSYRQTDNSTYNAMNYIEKAVLNSQGFDVNVCYLVECRKELCERYAYAILTLFFMRKRIKDAIGKEKWERYFNSCKAIDDSLTYIILNYKNMSKNNEKRIRKVIMYLALKYPKTFLKLFLRSKKESDVFR